MMTACKIELKLSDGNEKVTGFWYVSDRLNSIGDFEIAKTTRTRTT